MDRKIILRKLQYLYRLKKVYGYQKKPTEHDFDELNKIRNMIQFYEGLINSNYHDTWIEMKRVKLKEIKDEKKRQK